MMEALPVEIGSLPIKFLALQLPPGKSPGRRKAFLLFRIAKQLNISNPFF
jgi:hypothetical protein